MDPLLVIVNALHEEADALDAAHPHASPDGKTWLLIQALRGIARRIEQSKADVVDPNP